MFNLAIDTDNAAFADDFNGELVRCLRGVIAAIEAERMADAVRDTNGNAVGGWLIDGDLSAIARAIETGNPQIHSI